jgi:Phage gp6-like head-tail connector protein
VAGLQIEIAPQVEPVDLTDMKNYMKVEFSDDDTLISSLITAARELVEAFTARSLINKGYIQTLDSFPYFTDTVMSQMAYPPSYYSLPRYSTTLWNYSQMIKLLVSPLVSVTNIAYLASADVQWHSLLAAPPPWHPNVAVTVGMQFMDGNDNIIQCTVAGKTGFNPPTWNEQTDSFVVETTGVTWQTMGPAPLNELAAGGDAANTFFPDIVSEPPRIFPGPAGSFWPSVLYVPNAVEIHFVAGYGNTPANVPGRCLTAVMQLVAEWYGNREAISPLKLQEMPNHLKSLLWAARVMDFQPTRG